MELQCGAMIGIGVGKRIGTGPSSQIEQIESLFFIVAGAARVGYKFTTGTILPSRLTWNPTIHHLPKADLLTFWFL